MEILLKNVRSQIFPGKQTKDIYLCPSTTIDGLAEKITPTSPNFGLLLAMDAQSIDSSQIGELAEELIEKGLAYLCAWGLDCERVHDIFDEIEVQRNLEIEDNGEMMTTWHPDYTLEEALQFFVDSAFPQQPHEETCRDWIVAPIGNDKWEPKIRATFKVSWPASANKTESA